MNKQIEDRIQTLMMEQAALEHSHVEMVRSHQKMNDQFQTQVVKNQTRFAQIAGAITELKKLVPQPTQKDNNNDNLPTTPDFHNRVADVCPSGQSEDR
jgi:hypothetical protein